MRLLQTGEVAELARLTPHQVREWTERRKFVLPAIGASGPGTRNLFSWREIIVLRIAATARGQFGAELEVLRPFFAALRNYLGITSFPSLWNRVIVLKTPMEFVVVAETDLANQHQTAIIFPLDTHLDAITQYLSEGVRSEQLVLPLLGVQR